MKKWLIIVLVLVTLIIVLLFIRGNEDTWIKDDKGQFVKHGVPSETPPEVSEQQTAVACAQELYLEKKNSGMQFSSQCLGTCGNFAVDIAHVPRSAEDNLVENQCVDFRNGKVSRFIELDKDGNLIKVV